MIKAKKYLLNPYTMIILGLIILGNFIISRYFILKNPYLPGFATHLSEILSKNLISYLHGGNANPYHFIVYIGSYIMPITMFEIIFSYSLGIVSLYLIYKILKNIMSDHEIVFVLFILIFSPFFIYTFTFPTHYCLLVFLFLLGIYLLQKRSYLSLLVFVTITFFGIIDALFMLFVILMFHSYFAKNRILLYSSIWLLFYETVYYFIFGKLNFGVNLIADSSFSLAFSDFGGLFGLGLFIYILSFIGIANYWQHRRSLSYVFLSLVFISFTLLFFRNYVMIYLNFFISILAGKGFYNLYRIKWNFSELKVFTIFILICGILFSGIAFADRAIGMEPSTKLIDGIKAMQKIGDQKSIVFSHPKYGFWIQNYADKTPFCTPLKCNFNLSKTILYGRDIKETRKIINQTHIKYIMVTDEMRNGLVWNDKYEGLLFLLLNNETFINRYSMNGVDIFKIGGTQ